MITIAVIAVVVVAAVFVFLATRPVVPTRSAFLADIPAIVTKLGTLHDGSFAVFMFASCHSPGTDAINLQYSVKRGAVGLDWVLLGDANIADRDKVAAFASQLGHAMSEETMNKVHYLRAEGRDLDTLGVRIIVELKNVAQRKTRIDYRGLRLATKDLTIRCSQPLAGVGPSFP